MPSANVLISCNSFARNLSSAAAWALTDRRIRRGHLLPKRGSRKRTRFRSSGNIKCWSCLKLTSRVFIKAIFDIRFCALYVTRRRRRTADSFRKNCNQIIIQNRKCSRAMFPPTTIIFIVLTQRCIFSNICSHKKIFKLLPVNLLYDNNNNNVKK